MRSFSEVEISWNRTLQNVRDQLTSVAAASNLQLQGVDGEWYDVGNSQPSSGNSGRSESGLWRQQRWQEAFVVLVCLCAAVLAGHRR